MGLKKQKKYYVLKFDTCHERNYARYFDNLDDCVKVLVNEFRESKMYIISDRAFEKTVCKTASDGSSGEIINFFSDEHSYIVSSEERVIFDSLYAEKFQGQKFDLFDYDISFDFSDNLPTDVEEDWELGFRDGERELLKDKNVEISYWEY